MNDSPTIHASAVLAGARAVLIRGPAGSGKSRLVLELIQLAGRGAIPFARLVGDDRVHLAAASGRLLVRPALELAGLLEIRGFGIRRMPYEAVAAVGLIVDLGEAADRLPSPAGLETSIFGLVLPRLALPEGTSGMPALLAALGYPGSGI
jgi:serine kinase of HPr protein (carbohydrate metabolism regulator)